MSEEGCVSVGACFCMCVCIYEQSEGETRGKERERGWGGVVIGSAFTFVSFVSLFVLFTLCLKVCWSLLPTDMSLQRLFSLATVARTLIQLNWISIEMKNCRQEISWTPTFTFYLARINRTLYRERFEQINHIHDYCLMHWTVDCFWHQRWTVIDHDKYSAVQKWKKKKKTYFFFQNYLNCDLLYKGVHIMSLIV